MKRNKKGSVSLETTLVLSFVFAIVILFFLYAYFYFSAQSQNINLNFNTGRYVSTTGCSIENLSDMSKLSTYERYSITVNGQDINPKGNSNIGKIAITCANNSTKGSEFVVYTELVPNDVLPYFSTPSREVYYVQETD